MNTNLFKKIGIGIMLIFSISSIVYGATVLYPAGGGTGTSTPPTIGQILVGLSNGTYGPVATSTLGISGGSVAGSDTQIQYNNAGAFGANSGLTYSSSTNLVSIISTSTGLTSTNLRLKNNASYASGNGSKLSFSNNFSGSTVDVASIEGKTITAGGLAAMIFNVGVLGTSEMERILSNGNHLIGTTTDNGLGLLQVNGTTTVKTVLVYPQTGGIAQLGAAGTGYAALGFANDITGAGYTIAKATSSPDTYYNKPTGGSNYFLMNDNLGDAITMDENQNLGIHTNAPAAALDVQGTMLVTGNSTLASTTATRLNGLYFATTSLGFTVSTTSQALNVIGSSTLNNANVSGLNTGDQDLSGYVSTTSAASTYVTYPYATSTYLTQAVATSTFVTYSYATSTYQQSLITAVPSNLTTTGQAINVYNSASTTAGALVYFGPDQQWHYTNAVSSTTASSTGMLGITLESKTAGQAVKVAVTDGLITNTAWAWATGSPMYVGTTTNGTMIQGSPSATGNVNRVVGYALSNITIMFKPSDEYVVIK